MSVVSAYRIRLDYAEILLANSDTKFLPSDRRSKGSGGIDCLLLHIMERISRLETSPYEKNFMLTDKVFCKQHLCDLPIFI